MVLIIISLCSFIIGVIIGNMKKDIVYEGTIAELLNNNKILMNEINKVKVFMRNKKWLDM